LSSVADEITATAWQDVVVIERGQRGMAAALILHRKGYPRVHVGGGRVAGPGASAWFSVLRWANQELLVDIGLNAARHPDL
jgi:rhodanese-related sulfurtransferase